jgi:hypothetical protein
VLTNLTVLLEDRPGVAAEVGEALGAAGINIQAFSGFVVNRNGFAHVLVDDAAGARAALDGIVAIAEENEAFTFPLMDRPGALGEVARHIAERGSNIKFLYLATNNRLVIGTEDNDKARAAVEELELIPVG